MRGPSLVAIAYLTGTCVLAAALVVNVTSRDLPETASPAVIIDVPDNPATLAATEPEAAEVVSAVPNALSALPTSIEEALPQEPRPPEKLFIVDAIRLQLEEPSLRDKANASDLNALEAFYASRSGPALWLDSAGLTAAAKKIIKEISRADDWGLDSTAFALPSPDVQPTNGDEQAATEITLDLAILKYARYAGGGRVNLSALSKLIDQKPHERDPNKVIAEIATSDAPDSYLRDLNPNQVQFQLLHQALLKTRIRTDPASKRLVRKILVNMERWRWMPKSLGSLYVWLNVPEFMMYVVKDNEIIHSEKIVVGERAYATPIFSANMSSIVFNPEWTVPPTIVREDLLPKLRGGGGGWFGSSNTSILKQHRLKVIYNGREVDPDRIDWKKVNMSAISFKQAPGPRNVLGKVKFLYPNTHMVYMHDTIKRGLLNKTDRAEGHNCPRVDNPGKVAAVLLAEDKGWDQAKVNQLLEKGYNSAVNLDPPIPVHTTYFTAVADKNGDVRTFGDIYDLDGGVYAALQKQAPPQTNGPAPSPKQDASGDVVATEP